MEDNKNRQGKNQKKKTQTYLDVPIYPAHQLRLVPEQQALGKTFRLG